MPVGPHPNRRTLLPASICILSIPWVAQAAGSTRTASRSGKSPIGYTCRAGYLQYSAKPPGTRLIVKIRTPEAREMECIPLPPNAVKSSHSRGFRLVQWKQLRHGCIGSATTRSPTLKFVTLFPVAAIVPAASWPEFTLTTWFKHADPSSHLG